MTEPLPQALFVGNGGHHQCAAAPGGIAQRAQSGYKDGLGTWTVPAPELSEPVSGSEPPPPQLLNATLPRTSAANVLARVIELLSFEVGMKFRHLWHSRAPHMRPFVPYEARCRPLESSLNT